MTDRNELNRPDGILVYPPGHSFGDLVIKREIESDPNGLDPKAPGAKLDAGKPRPALVLGDFALALKRVTDVGTHGLGKYSPGSWLHVPEGIDRYTEAMWRHLLDEASGEEIDTGSGLEHAAHLAWNALARLELMLRERE